MPTIDAPDAISRFQLVTIKSAVKLESKGMTHSSRKSVRKHACIMLGLPTSTKHDKVIEALERRIAAMDNPVVAQ